MEKMFGYKVESIKAVANVYKNPNTGVETVSRAFECVVYAPGAVRLQADCKYKEIESFKVLVYENVKSKEFYGKLYDEDVFYSFNRKAKCVQDALSERNEQIQSQKDMIAAIEKLATIGLTDEDKKDLAEAHEKLIWLQDPKRTVCDFCRKDWKEKCSSDIRAKAIYLTPKIKLSPETANGATWNVVSSCASIVSKLKNPSFPNNLKSGMYAGLQSCENCAFAKWITYDQTLVDAISGMALHNPDEVEYRRSTSLLDAKQKKEIEVNDARYECTLKGVDCKQGDVCSGYVYKEHLGSPNIEYPGVKAVRFAEVVDGKHIQAPNAHVVSVY